MNRTEALLVANRSLDEVLVTLGPELTAAERTAIDRLHGAVSMVAYADPEGSAAAHVLEVYDLHPLLPALFARATSRREEIARAANRVFSRAAGILEDP